MEWVEMTAPTVEEATRRALDHLGVVESDAEIVVLEEPKTGLFGRLKVEARVRARIRPAGPRPKRTRRGRGRGSGSTRPSEVTGSREPKERAVPAAAREGRGDRERPERREGSGGGRSRSRRGGRGGSGAAREAANGSVAVKEAHAASTREDDGDMAEGMTLEEQGQVAKTFLEGLTDAFGLEAEVSVRLIDDETVEVAVDGKELGILVGPRGATLAALQEVTRTAVQAKCPSRTDRILVDVAHYRERRAKALSEYTATIAAEVVASGEEHRLEPMSPADRKVVHDAATEIAGVATRSEGEDPDRYVVISPA